MFIKKQSLTGGQTRTLTGWYTDGGVEEYTRIEPETLGTISRIVARVEVSFDENADGLQTCIDRVEELLNELKDRQTAGKHTP